jgi:hypothetical protein
MTSVINGVLTDYITPVSIIFPYGQGYGSPFPASYRCILGTLRVQFGNRYAETARKERSELYGDFGTH